MPACPPPNPLWLQVIVTGAPALLIGLLAWLVNRGQLDVSQAQLNVAQEKLRHDLFERRFAVFYAFQTLLLAVATSKKGEEVKPAIDDTVAKLATARFLFAPDVFEYLRNTFMATATLSNRDALLEDPLAWDTPRARTAAMMEHSVNKLALYDKIDEIAAKVAPDLRLRDLGPR